MRFTGVSLRTVNSFYPLAPIIGAAFERRDRDDPDVIRLFDVNHRIGERQPEVPPRGRHDGAETGGPRADFCQKIVDVVVNALAEFGAHRSVVHRCLGELVVGVPVEAVGLHKPTILRASRTGSGFGLWGERALTRRAW